jgi:hypothetical protein
MQLTGEVLTGSSPVATRRFFITCCHRLLHPLATRQPDSFLTQMREEREYTTIRAGGGSTKMVIILLLQLQAPGTWIHCSRCLWIQINWHSVLGRDPKSWSFTLCPQQTTGTNVKKLRHDTQPWHVRAEHSETVRFLVHVTGTVQGPGMQTVSFMQRRPTSVRSLCPRPPPAQWSVEEEHMACRLASVSAFDQNLNSVQGPCVCFRQAGEAFPPCFIHVGTG